RHLVGAEVEIARGEQLYQLANDGFQRRVDRLHRRVEAVVRELLDRMVEAVLAWVAQLRQRLQHGVAVSRHVDLGHHVDAEVARARYQLADARLAVGATRGFRAGAEQRGNGKPVTAPAGNAREFGI